MKIILRYLLTMTLVLGLGFSTTVFAQGKIKDDQGAYSVVINHEEQYSIWLGDRKTPVGWKATGMSGTKKECLKYIEEVWTDMRPLSHRRHQFSAQSKYGVVINHEEQYSIWPVDKKLPKGWAAEGKQGSQQECLDYIKGVWTDMRPLSIRKAMQDIERKKRN